MLRNIAFLKHKSMTLFMVMVAMVVSVMQSAHATITETDLSAIGTSITTDANTVFTWALPVFGTVMALIIGMKLVKTFTSKIG